MRITLAEEREGRLLPEKSFDGPVVTVGRDSRRCHVVFKPPEGRMVSRLHAEFRWEGGRCMLADMGSTYGTFLDGNALKEPAAVRAGSRVRFGLEGPVIVVSSAINSAATQHEESAEREESVESEKSFKLEELVELVVSAAREEPRQPEEPRSREESRPRDETSQSPPTPPAASVPDAQTSAVIHMAGVDGAHAQEFPLAGEVLRIGRDPRMDVVVGASSAVSRHHAEIRRNGDHFVLADVNSFNGTLLNGQRIAHAVPLYEGDEIQLGLHGPVFIFGSSPRPSADKAAPEGARREDDAGSRDGGAARRTAADGEHATPSHDEEVKTAYVEPAVNWLGRQLPRRAAQGAQPIICRNFKSKSALTVGRAEGNDICLAGLQISARHADIARRDGEIFIEDNDSTNGVYVNGVRVDKRQLGAGDIVQIGPYVLRAAADYGVRVFDTRANTRVRVADVSRTAPGRAGRPDFKLLDEVGFSIEPNEFVGILGPSGAGKSTLLGTMNGTRPADSGRVLINGLDLYSHLDSLKQYIGYIPQEDISHRELTVYRTLYYVAHLRLSRDVSESEIADLVDDILDVTELSEQRDVCLGNLSGGQRKRAAIAVELVTKPSVIFLDEPTSGLDPVAAGKIMKFFRHVAVSGRTVVMTTHLMEDVSLFHKIAILMRGRLVFYGTPRDALDYFRAGSFREIYDRLEAQADGAAAGASRGQALEAAAVELKSKFRESEQSGRHAGLTWDSSAADARTSPPPRSRPSLYEQFLQWAVLVRRYMEVLAYDRTSLLIMLAQSPVIGLFTFIAVKADAPRDFAYFVLALVSMWLGTSAAAREIVKERAIYARERMVNMGLLPYVGSKLFVLALLVGAQCVLLFGTLKLFHYAGLTELPGWAAPQLLVMILTGLTGIALGLFISALAKTSEMATGLVPLVLIPQLLFSGLIGVPTGASRALGVVMPTTWSFDELKRQSGLPVLWGAERGGKSSQQEGGRGLYEQIEFENGQGQKAFDDYQADARRAVEDFERRVGDYEKELDRFRNGDTNVRPPEPAPLALKPLPAARVKPPPKDVSDYVGYMHPWGGPLNTLVLLAMLSLLTGATLFALKRQDVG